jgi:hypothetical protein
LDAVERGTEKPKNVLISPEIWRLANVASDQSIRRADQQSILITYAHSNHGGRFRGQTSYAAGSCSLGLDRIVDFHERLASAAHRFDHPGDSGHGFNCRPTKSRLRWVRGALEGMGTLGLGFYRWHHDGTRSELLAGKLAALQKQVPNNHISENII